MKETLLIIGAGQAAIQAVISLRQMNYQGNIKIIGEEPFLPYQRPPLSKKFLAGQLDKNRLFIRSKNFYQRQEIELLLNSKVASIDPKNQNILTEDGNSLNYSKLLIATGSRARELKVPGINLSGIHYLRNINNVQTIQNQMVAGNKLVIIGAGYIGLEVASVAVKLGLDVTILETESRVMNRVVASEISNFFELIHKRAGVKFKFKQKVEGFAGDTSLKEVLCSGGKRYAADLCIIGIGNLPNQEIAAQSGINYENGILVDEYCQTSEENIFSAGDCTNHPNKLIGMNLRLESVHNAIEQGKTSASSITGTKNAYNQIPWFWSDQYDLKLQIVGLSQGYNELIIRGNPKSKSFSGFYMKNRKILAVDAINKPREFMLAKKLISAGVEIDPEKIADSTTDFKFLAEQALKRGI